MQKPALPQKMGCEKASTHIHPPSPPQSFVPGGHLSTPVNAVCRRRRQQRLTRPQSSAAGKWLLIHTASAPREQPHSRRSEPRRRRRRRFGPRHRRGRGGLVSPGKDLLQDVEAPPPAERRLAGDPHWHAMREAARFKRQANANAKTTKLNGTICTCTEHASARKNVPVYLNSSALQERCSARMRREERAGSCWYTRARGKAACQPAKDENSRSRAPSTGWRVSRILTGGTVATTIRVPTTARTAPAAGVWGPGGGGSNPSLTVDEIERLGDVEHGAQVLGENAKQREVQLDPFGRLKGSSSGNGE